MNTLLLKSSNSDVAIEFSDAADDHFSVAVVARDHSASRRVDSYTDANGMARLFTEAARDWKGWDGCSVGLPLRLTALTSIGGLEKGEQPVILDIPAIAGKLNKLAEAHPIGRLQDIRTDLKKLKRRPGDKVFSAQTTFDNWAFHHGGRTELQFNIGREHGESLRNGVAFSFELSQTLKSIDVLVPKVKLFNDFIQSNAGEFGDMRMWHYDDGLRSVDYTPGPISSALVKERVFLFLGNRQSAQKLDYGRILDDFDRLLPLCRYVESAGTTEAVPLSKERFEFRPGYSKRASTAKATLAEKELDLDLRHNLIQQALYGRLASQYGRSNVRTEQPSGLGTQIDIVVKRKSKYWFYEIKIALTPRACLREAIGQLLEYGFWPGAHEPTRFVVVGEKPIDGDGKDYLRRLRERFLLPIEYETVEI